MSSRSGEPEKYAELGNRMKDYRLDARIDTHGEWLDMLSRYGVIMGNSKWSKVESGSQRPSRPDLLGIMRLLADRGHLCSVEEVEELLRLAEHWAPSDDELRVIFGSAIPIREWETEAKAGAMPAAPECPYRGLFAFRTEDAPYFFGREAATAKLLRHVAIADCIASSTETPSSHHHLLMINSFDLRSNFGSIRAINRSPYNNGKT